MVNAWKNLDIKKMAGHSCNLIIMDEVITDRRDSTFSFAKASESPIQRLLDPNQPGYWHHAIDNLSTNNTHDPIGDVAATFIKSNVFSTTSSREIFTASAVEEAREENKRRAREEKKRLEAELAKRELDKERGDVFGCW